MLDEYLFYRHESLYTHIHKVLEKYKLEMAEKVEAIIKQAGEKREAFSAAAGKNIQYLVIVRVM